jgi:multicomponent Na+:H+ antiporter subunit E
MKFPLTFLVVFLLWVCLTQSLEYFQLSVGLALSLIIAFVSKDVLFGKKAGRTLNPLRWARFVAYVFVMVIAELESHAKVAFCILTGKISPAFVSVPCAFKSDSGKTLFGNSITMTPGTLTVDTEGDEFLIHMLRKGRLTSWFERFGRGVTE